MRAGSSPPFPKAFIIPTETRGAGDLWHVVLFYTTGEAVRRILADDGQPAYTPVLYAIFARGTWTEYRQALESNWQPYVDEARSPGGGERVGRGGSEGGGEVGGGSSQSGRNE